jgi:hypothetical protein
MALFNEMKGRPNNEKLDKIIKLLEKSDSQTHYDHGIGKSKCFPVIPPRYVAAIRFSIKKQLRCR